MTHTVTLTLPEGVKDSAWPAIAERVRADGYHWIADSIEEQVKSAIPEPIAFASVVRDETGARFVRVGALIKQPWRSGEERRSWDELDVAEVLRIGVGEPGGKSKKALSAYDEGYGNGQYAGFSQALESVAGKVSALRSEAITAERKNAYEVVLDILAEMQP